MIGRSFRNVLKTGLFGALVGLMTGFGSIFGSVAFAADGQVEGHAVNGQIGFQPAETVIMDSIESFHNNVLIWIVGAIVLMVLLLLAWIVIRFNARANPVPSKTTHNTLIEIVWTVVPILILIVIAVPSFGVLADQETIPDGVRKYLGANIFSFGSVEVPAPGLTVKATGVQWNWDYDYVDYDNADFSSFILSEDERHDLKPDQPRLLATDTDLVIPVDTTVRVLVTGADVIHSFAVPSFGIKVDAVPGRTNETWFNARHIGMFYGQCSELCGKDHAFMPISVRVVSKDDFDAWMTELQANGVDSANELLGPVT